MRRMTLYLGCMLLYAASVFSQVDVTIPNASGDGGETVLVPVNVSDLTGLGVISFQFKINFDEDIIDAIEVKTEGTLSSTSGWSIIKNLGVEGQVTVGGFGTSDLAGSGTLVNIEYTVVGSPTETSDMSFVECIFNGGDPSSNTTDGVFTVTGTLIDITVTTNIGSGTKVYVDGEQKDAPYSTQWYENTSHTIGVDNEQSGGSGIKYIFDSWSHGGNREQTVTPSTSTTFTANLNTQYLLTVNSDHDNPQGAGWYNSGADAEFSVTSPADESNGTRYVFTNWSGDHSGTDASASITMDSPKEVTANWQTHYYLTTANNPAAGGEVSPSPPGAWYDSGSNAEIDATVASGYEWAGWTGDASGTTRPKQILMNSPKSVTANYGRLVEITINTNLSGREFQVDGTTYSSEQVFNWVENSEHELSVSSPQTGAAGVRYLYSSWSDGGSQSHTYTVPGTDATVTVNFQTQYYLTVNSDHDNPQGEDWYNSGTNANFSVTTPADESDGTRYVFTNWSGDYSGTNASASITMNSPKEVTANWQTQYYLTVNSARDNPQGAGWYNSGTNADFSVTTPADESNGTRYVFTNWSGDYSGTDASASITMNLPKEVTANWQTHYYLTTANNPAAGGEVSPSPPGAWYDSGSNAEIDATVASGYEWAGWTGDASGTTRPKQILMNSPKSVTANYGRLVEITINTNLSGREFQVDGTTYSSEQVFNWVENSEHELSVSSPQTGAAGVRYLYSSWSDGGSQSHTYTVPGTDATVTVNFQTQYYLTVNSDHDNPQGEDWYNSGTNANFSVTTPADESDGTRYVFTNWSGDYSGTNASASITMNSPKEVTANWQTQYYLTVNSARDNPQGAGWYNSGTNADFSVTTPADESNGTRYVFTNWSGDYSGTDASASITMNSPKEVTANWQTQYFLTTAVNPENGGTMEPNPPGAWYASGANVNLSANAIGIFQWVGWSGDKTGPENPTQITMTSKKQVTANFVSSEDVSTPDRPNGPSTGITGQSLTFSTGGSQSNLGHQVEYKFDWGDGGQSDWGAATKNHIYTQRGNYQVKARARCSVHNEIVSNWSNARNTSISSLNLEVAVNPPGAGSVNKTPNKDGYDYNESVRLTANVLNGAYQFENWSGDLSGSQNPNTIIMNENKTVTANFINETVSVPNTPNGPNEGVVGETLEFSTGGSSSSFGHDVEYQLDYGDGNLSDWGDRRKSYSYTATGSYTIRARARCSTHQEIMSDWSGGHQISLSGLILTINVNPDTAGNVEINPNKDEYNHLEFVQLRAIPANGSFEFAHWSGDIAEDSLNPRGIYMKRDREITANFAVETIPQPSVPVGPGNGSSDETITFTTENLTTSFGHPVVYQFDWGDGSTSGWGENSQSYIYDSAGTMQVKVRARCQFHGWVVSEWSDFHNIVISDYTLTININPVGTGTVSVNPEKEKYAEGEQVELTAFGLTGYSFDSWRGDIQDSENPTAITLQQSLNITANFIITPEIVSPPQITGPDSGFMGQNLSFSASGSQSNMGNELQYQFNWGDANLSLWGDGNGSHIYYVTGQVEVRARARSVENTSVVSLWSEPKIIQINGHRLEIKIEPTGWGNVNVNPMNELYADGANVQLIAIPEDGFMFSHWTDDLIGNENPNQIMMTGDKKVTAHFAEAVEIVTVPNTPEGLENGVVGQNLIFIASGSINTFANEIEYQFDWGDGTLSSWDGNERSHIYFFSDTVNVKVRARSKVNPNIISSWSNPHTIIIIGFVLNLNIEPAASGLIAENPFKTEYAYHDTVVLYPVGKQGFMFDRWSGDLVGNDNPAQLVMDKNKNVTSVFKQIGEMVSKPALIDGPDQGYRAQPLQFKVTGSESNMGHAVEYQFNWGDGQLSEWGDSTQIHNYSKSGNFIIQGRARSKNNISVISEWSDEKKVSITGCKLTVDVVPENSGDIEKDPNQIDYDFGSDVNISAVNSVDYAFAYWNNDTRDTLSVKSLMMNKDTTLVANFRLLSSVKQKYRELPKEFFLKQNYPNPFNPETKIEFLIPIQSYVKVTIYNIKGQIIQLLVDEMKAPGYHSVIWNGQDRYGNRASSGIYLYRIETESYNQIRKMLLIK